MAQVRENMARRPGAAVASPGHALGLSVHRPRSTSAGALLDLQRGAGNAAVASLLAGAPVQRRGQGDAKPKRTRVGVARYGDVRLTDRLRDMQARGVLGRAGAPPSLTAEQLSILQGVANVETGGADNAVYTVDNMIVSLGFKQVTLVWGSLYDVIRLAPAPFAKHGIVIGGGTYKFQKYGKTVEQPAFEGAPDPQVLRTAPWPDRFFAAAAEDEAISAMVAFTLRELGQMNTRIGKQNRGRSNPWMQDPTAQAWLFETKNNRPAYAWRAARETLRRTDGKELTREEFLDVLEAEIRAAYTAKNEGGKANNIIKKIPRTSGAAAAARRPGAKAGGLAPAGGASLPAPKAAKGVDLVEPAAAVLPPTAATGAGSVALQAMAALGLEAAAVRVLVAAGYRDANALTNLAFWIRHSNLLGTKLLPGQPGFASLAAEWRRLRDGVVAESLRSPGTAASAPMAATATPPGAATTPATKAATSPTPAAPVSPNAGETAPPDMSSTTRRDDVVHDGMRSTVQLLPPAQRKRFEAIRWGWADYPGTQFPVEGKTPEEQALWDSDRALVRAEVDGQEVYVGKHQNDAKALFSALAANRPGGGERRVNTGAAAVLTKEDYRKDPRAIDTYIESQLVAAPHSRGQRLNNHAAGALERMQAKAAGDGVPIVVLSGFRGRSAEARSAQKHSNRYAVGAFSPHSLGLAMDVALKAGTSANAGFTEISTKMTGLVEMLRSPVYKWIYLHGAEFGFYQYKMEPWHWEYNPDGFKKTYWAGFTR